MKGPKSGLTPPYARYLVRLTRPFPDFDLLFVGVVLFGAKTSDTGAGVLLNPLLRFAVSRLSFPTTPGPDSEPWRMVVQRVERLDIEDHFFGSMFLASGSYIRDRGAIV
jgi:hypothetical protein